MPLRNRVDPWGDLHAVEERGLFTGNRGCLVDEHGAVVRHHRGSLWIICLTEYRGWRSPLTQPRHWTPIFFLDDAVGLAAGHRPCGLCRREAYLSYRDAIATAERSPRPLTALDLNRRLAGERSGPRSEVDLDRLPDGVMVVGPDRRPRLVLGDRLLLFTFGGWTDPIPRPRSLPTELLTPPTSISALTHGFFPVLHPTALVRT